jgi:hypothetical protein
VQPRDGPPSCCQCLMAGGWQQGDGSGRHGRARPLMTDETVRKQPRPAPASRWLPAAPADAIHSRPSWPPVFVWRRGEWAKTSGFVAGFKEVWRARVPLPLPLGPRLASGSARRGGSPAHKPYRHRRDPRPSRRAHMPTQPMLRRQEGERASSHAPRLAQARRRQST